MTATRPSLRALAAYFLRLGAVGFGGPIALVGYMQRDLVESRHWITEKEYKEGLALAQLAPGPLAAQLAMYFGWVCGSGWGATLTGIAFVAPSFLMVLALSVAYVHFDGLPWMQRVFYGVGAAVIAIIARSAIKLVRMTLGKDALLWVLFVVSAAVTAWTGSEIVWVFFLCGLVPVVVRTVPRASTLASVAPIGFIFSYFAGAGLFVFGSGLAIVPFLHGGVVQKFHWITERQFLDAVAVSLITPGPVVITVAFIGYLVAGLAGACAAAAGVFLPVYCITLLLAPSFHRWAQNARVKAFVEGVTAAATGAIAGAVIVLGRRALGDVGSGLIAAATFALLVTTKRIPEPFLILGAGVAGLVLY